MARSCCHLAIDLSNQLRLFVREDNDVGLRPECLLREIGETEFIRRHQCSVRSLAAFEKSEYTDDWRELMRLYLVRRTRSFIQENYADVDCSCSAVIKSHEAACSSCGKQKSKTARRYLTFHDGTRSYFPTRSPKTVKFKIDDTDPNGLNGDADFQQRAAQIYSVYAGSLKRRFRWLDSSRFVPQLEKDLKADAHELQGVLQRAGQWDPQRHSNLKKLCKLLTRKHAGEKVLVFTQFADTVKYLASQLQARGIERVAPVTGDTDNPTKVAWRFSPVSNDRADEIMPAQELDVLIATDVLSEGQNLQDAAIIVNFDLPWAIIRLIQRAGRVDRIGQKSDEIRCYTFLPAAGVERVIRLRARVRQRLKENAEVVGTDEAFFEDDQNDQAVQELFTEMAGILDGDADTEVDLGFAVVGVGDLQRAQEDVTSWARDVMVPPVTLDFTVGEIAGKPVIAIEVEELAAAQMPCYNKNRGLNGGSYIRAGGTDRRMTDYEVFTYVSARGQPLEDEQLVEDATVEDLSDSLLEEYLGTLLGFWACGFALVSAYGTEGASSNGTQLAVPVGSKTRAIFQGQPGGELSQSTADTSQTSTVDIGERVGVRNGRGKQLSLF